ncbi:hypothetical protein LCGC14_3000070, partial [marine sediment metagenome]
GGAGVNGGMLPMLRGAAAPPLYVTVIIWKRVRNLVGTGRA